MGKYGEAAERAAHQLVLDEADEVDAPAKAWEQAILKVFPDSPSSRSKGCPRGSFLGLCEKGLIIGVLPGAYTNSIKNKDYAIKALKLIKHNPHLLSDKKELWNLVIDGADKQQNSQMDVVVTLWNNNRINQNVLASI